jgi:hypothetical protein
MQQSVGATGCPIAKIATFHHGYIAAAQRQIMRRGDPGKSCSDDDHMRFTHPLSEFSP